MGVIARKTLGGGGGQLGYKNIWCERRKSEATLGWVGWGVGGKRHPPPPEHF